jgi:hypothetical protein
VDGGMGQMVKDEVFERILENKERAFVLTNSCTPESILTWNDVERYLNDNTHNTEITIIGDNKQKKDVYKSTETSGTPSDVIFDEVNNGSSFILNYMERHTKGLFYASNMCSRIHNMYVTTNIYGGIKNNSKSFETHADSQYVLILQLDGESDWTIYGETWNGKSNEVVCVNDSILTVDFRYTLQPGDVCYIPYRRYHKCIPLSKRLSASVSADYDTVRPENYGNWFGLN